VLQHCDEKARSAVEVVRHEREADRAAGGNVLGVEPHRLESQIATRRTLMAGKIEIRKSGEKFRFVVLNRNGEKLLQSGQFDDKPSTRRAASSLAKAVSGAQIVDATKPAAAVAKSSARRPRMKR
jgi:uncharacterized protein YegP (UPF0339 family)